MPYRRSLAALGLVAALAAPSAFAQTKKPVAAGTPPTPAATPAPQTEPPMPDVSDPLLQPPPPPTRVLQSWQQGLQLVRDQSINMRVARANVLQAEAIVEQTLAPALPQVVGTGSVQHYLLRGHFTDFNTNTQYLAPNPSTIWAAQATLTVPLFRPSVWYNHGSAKEALEAQKLTNKEVERQVIAGVAYLIVGVVTAERLTEVSRESLRAALATVDLTKRRAALGASNTLDVLRVEGEASLSRSQVVSTTENLIRAREALGAALGSSEAWGVTQDIQLDSLAADAQKNCHMETDITARSDVRAADANLGVSERHLKGVDYAYLPTLDANSTLGVQDPRFAYNNRYVTWTIGALLTWQIYDGGLRGGQRTAAKAEIEVSKADLDETKRAARLEVQQAVRNVQVAEANLAVSAKTREIDAETARLSKISFLNGSGTSFDLVTTESLLRVAEADLAVKEFQVTEAKIAAILAMATCEI